MDDYISRKELIEHIKAHCKYCDGCGEVIHCAIDTPAADVKPVRHGHWIEWAEFFGRETDKKNLGVFCSRCRLYADNGFDYCPNCGAKMDGGGGT